MRAIQELTRITKNEDFYSLADSFTDIVAQFDLSLRHLFVNRAVEKATGLPREAFIGKTNRDLEMPENLVNLWDRQLIDIFKSGKASEIIFDYTSPEGPRTFQMLGAPRFDADKNVDTVLVITRDITDQRKKTDELILAAKYASATHLCHELAHHLNNPLAVILSSLRLLERALPTEGADKERFERYLSAMNEGSLQISEIIHTMGKWTDFRNEFIQSKMEVMSLNEIFSLGLALCEKKEVRSGVRCELTGDYSFMIETDISDLIEVVFQLMSNAFEAAKQSQDPWVKIGVQENLTEIIISIVDSGSGIKEFDFQKMLQPFYTTKGPSARGMGLTISKTALNRLGGHLKFDESAINTTFLILLPKSIKSGPSRN
jgi:PAS domain S-box-containing protein